MLTMILMLKLHQKEIDNAKIDIANSMVIGNESVPVEDLDFHKDAEKDAQNLVESSKQEIGVLSIQNVNREKKLILTGKLLQSDLKLTGSFYEI